MKYLYNAIVQKPATANAMMKLGFSCNVLRHFLPCFRLLPSPYSTSTSSSSSSSSIKSNDKFSVFLKHSMGFSNLESVAVSSKLANQQQIEATKKVSDFNFSDNAISVVRFFEKLGFQKLQIKDLVRNEPRVLLSSVEDSLNPKIKLLTELGTSDDDVIKILSINPSLLCTRLDSVIDAFRIVMNSDKDIVTKLKRLKYVGGAVSLRENVQLLRNSYNIPVEKIRACFSRSNKAFLMESDLFREIVVKVVEKLGIPPDSKMFVYGVDYLMRYSEESLEKKRAMIKRYGWTDANISALIRRNPFCFTVSESVMEQKLDFLMKKLGYTPDYLLTRIPLLTSSLENRLLPRHRILQLLNDEGKRNCSLCSVSYLSEPAFVKRFVLPFEEVHEVYAQLTGFKVDSFNVGRANSQS